MSDVSIDFDAVLASANPAKPEIDPKTGFVIGSPEDAEYKAALTASVVTHYNADKASLMARHHPVSKMPIELRSVARWCFAMAEDKSPAMLDASLNPYRISVTADVGRLYSYEHIMSLCHARMEAGLPELYIGFVLAMGDGFTCVDLDADETTPQEVLDNYRHLMEEFDTYTEVSKSGWGLHLWIRGEMVGAVKRKHIEAYSRERFIICTGKAINGTYAKNDPEIIKWLNTLVQANNYEVNNQPQTESDEVVVARCYEFDHTGKFRALMEGNWAQYVSIRSGQGRGEAFFDASEGDASFFGVVTYFTKNFEQAERIWRMSKLSDMEARYHDRPDQIAAKTRRFRRPDKLARAIAFAMNKNIEDQKQRDILSDTNAALGRKLAESMGITSRMGVPEPELEAMPVTHPAMEAQNVARAMEAYDWPPGMIGELAQHYYRISGRPIKEFAIVSALATMSGICGLAFNIQKYQAGLNNYFLVLAPSGVGKSMITDLPEKLFSELAGHYGCITARQFMSRSSFTHENSLLRALEESPSLMWASNEFGVDFLQMAQDSGGSKATIPGALTSLYDRSGYGKTVRGIAYTDKAKTIEMNHPVALTLLAESVASVVFDNITPKMFEDGFMSRIMFIQYEGIKPYERTVADSSLPRHLGEYLAQVVERVGPMVSSPDTVVPTFVGCDPEAQAWIEAFSRQCDDQYNSVAESDVWIRATCNRYAEKTLRIATLLAVADNALGSPQVGLHHLQWAQSFVGAHNQLILNAARRGAFGGSGDDARGVSVLSGFLADYLKGMVPVPPSVQRPEEAEAMRSQGCVSYSVLYKRLCHKAPFHNHRRGVKQGIQSCLDIMVDRGLLAIMPSPTALSMFNTTAKVYIVKGFDND